MGIPERIHPRKLAEATAFSYYRIFGFSDVTVADDDMIDDTLPASSHREDHDEGNRRFLQNLFRSCKTCIIVEQGQYIDCPALCIRLIRSLIEPNGHLRSANMTCKL